MRNAREKSRAWVAKPSLTRSAASPRTDVLRPRPDARADRVFRARNAASRKTARLRRRRDARADRAYQTRNAAFRRTRSWQQKPDARADKRVMVVVLLTTTRRL